MWKVASITELHCDEDFNVLSTSTNVVTFKQPVTVMIANTSEVMDESEKKDSQSDVETKIESNSTVIRHPVESKVLASNQNSTKGCTCNKQFFEYFRVSKLIGKFQASIGENSISEKENFFLKDEKFYSKRVSYECVNSSWKCNCVDFRQLDCACLDDRGLHYLTGFVGFVLFVVFSFLLCLPSFLASQIIYVWSNNCLTVISIVLLMVSDIALWLGIIELIYYVDNQIYLSYCSVTPSQCE